MNWLTLTRPTVSHSTAFRRQGSTLPSLTLILCGTNHLHKTTPPSLSRTSYRLTTVLPPPTLKILTPSPTLPMPLASLTINPDYFQPNLELGLTSLLLAMRTISRPLWKILRRKTGLGECLISRCKSQCFACIDDVTHGVLSIASPSLYNQMRRF